MRRPALFWADVAFKVALVALLAFGAFSGLEQFEGKAFGWRLLGYPIAAAVVPIGWWLAGRPRPYPYALDIFIVAPFLVDVVGNVLDLYDTIEWWDDLNHFVNWALLSFGFGQLVLRFRLGRVETFALVVGAGAVAAILWELGEYVAFIRNSPELESAYEDTLGDMTLGLTGSVVAALASATWLWRRARRPGSLLHRDEDEGQVRGVVPSRRIHVHPERSPAERLRCRLHGADAVRDRVRRGVADEADLVDADPEPAHLRRATAAVEPPREERLRAAESSGDARRAARPARDVGDAADRALGAALLGRGGALDPLADGERRTAEREEEGAGGDGRPGADRKARASHGRAPFGRLQQTVANAKATVHQRPVRLREPLATVCCKALAR